RRVGTQDSFTGVGIGKGSANEGYHLHHICPHSVLRDKSGLRRDSQIVDQVANLVCLSVPSSKSLMTRPPAKYLPDIEEQRLRAQYMPLQPDLWELDQFEKCMQRRRKIGRAHV